MKKFDENYILLKDMYEDGYFPNHLVGKVKELILELIAYLEMGEQDIEKIQEKLNHMTIGINDLQEEFNEKINEIKKTFNHFNFKYKEELELKNYRIIN